MGLPYRAKTVALFFLENSEKEETSISPMKLQKLIYFAHGWCLAITGSPLIEESVDAWRYGPVIGNVYYWLRPFGSFPIQLKELNIDGEDLHRLVELKKDEVTTSILKKVWDEYKGYDAIELSKMTHLPMSPWEKARDGISPVKFNVTINDNLIKDYFITQSKRK